jgi:dipeptidyl aminopeptidase/acylaminoacyl peptidase
MNTISLVKQAVAVAVLLVSPAAGAQPESREVVFPGDGGLELRGTLLFPAADTDTRVPAMLLLPGSGPTDRDGNQQPILKTDLLRQIAERLAAEGVATLRFDKRAVRAYQASWPKDPAGLDEFFAFEHFTGDAAAAYQFLRDQPRINPARMSILGHSEGGLIALQLGADMAGTPRQPAGLVLAGTAGRTLDLVLREQIANLLPRQGADEATIKQYMEALDAAIAAVRTGRPLPADLPTGLRPLFNPTVLKLLRSYFTIDPADLAARVKGSVLILQGEKDSQVSARQDTPRLENALRSRAGSDAEVLVVPGASHNLKKITGDADPGFTGPVAPEALDRLAAWCKAALRP